MVFKTNIDVKVFSDGSFCFMSKKYLSKNSFNFFLKTNFQDKDSVKTNKNILIEKKSLKFNYRKKILVT